MVCHICGSKGNNAVKYPFGEVPGEGITCVDAVMDNVRVRKGLCEEVQRRYLICCNGTRLQRMVEEEDVSPIVEYLGPNRVCDLCYNGVFPSDPSHVIHLLYVGASTCKGYYVAGLQGRIPNHLCAPLQFFAKGPCGCGSVRRFVAASTTVSTTSVTSTVGRGVIFCLFMVIIFMRYFLRLRRRYV